MHNALPAGATKRTLLAAALTSCLVLANVAQADSCGRVNAYWQSNMVSLVQNINECGKSSWQKCSQAAAIHYDLIAGSLGQRAQKCGLATPAVPGVDYTEANISDNGQCLTARDDLREAFENRALARLACAAAREGGSDQEWLDSQCKLYRSRMSNYHLPFRTVVQHCEIGYEQQVATLDE